MSSLTTRLALTKPVDPEAIDVSILNANSDIIDSYMGAILVNAGVTPPNSQLFDGAIVKEKGTGIVWVAQKNGGGGFDKSYIRYVYSGVFQGTTAALANDNVLHTCAMTARLTNRGVNSVDADLNGADGWVAPATATYRGYVDVNFGFNGTGKRTADINCSSGYTAGGYMQRQISAEANFATQFIIPFESIRLSAGDVITIKAQQNSGITLACAVRLHISVDYVTANL